MSKENTTHPQQSEAYEKARLQGKSILFVCYQGQERSPQSAIKAKRRGEIHTDFLSGGTQGFDTRVLSPHRTALLISSGAFSHSISPEQELALMSTLYKQAKNDIQKWVKRNNLQEKFLRIFNDEHNIATQTFIHCIKQEGISYEVVTISIIKAENQKLGTPVYNTDDDFFV